MNNGWARILYFPYQWLVYVPLLVLTTAIGSTLVVILSLTFRARRLCYYIAMAWARSLIWITPVRLYIKGKEHVEKGHSYIVVANHQSYYDIPSMYGFAGLDLKFVMKKELKRVPFLGQGVATMGHVFVDRSDRQQAIDSINASVKRLDPGESVIIYPEGTRSRTGEVQEFRKGAFRLAINTGLPILPISVAGTYRIQPPDTLQLLPGKAGLKIHPPIDVKGRTEEDIPELMQECRERIVRGKKEMEEEYGLS